MKATKNAALALALAVASTGAFSETNGEGLSIFGGASAVTSALKIQGDDDVFIEGLGKSSLPTSIGAYYGLTMS